MQLHFGGELMHDKRNPSIIRGDGETLESYLSRLQEYLSRITWQSEGHRMWYTHKNPSGCWICELLQIGELLQSELMAFRRDTDESDGEPGETNID